MTAMSKKSEDHAREIGKLRSQLLAAKAEVADAAKVEGKSRQLVEEAKSKCIEEYEAKCNNLSKNLEAERKARVDAEKIVENSKNLLTSAREAAAKQKKSLESRIVAAKDASDRKLRQLEQCLSIAEERADRAEAEAHDAHVESQLAGTLGIKVSVAASLSSLIFCSPPPPFLLRFLLMSM